MFVRLYTKPHGAADPCNTGVFFSGVSSGCDALQLGACACCTVFRLRVKPTRPLRRPVSVMTGDQNSRFMSWSPPLRCTSSWRSSGSLHIAANVSQTCPIQNDLYGSPVALVGSAPHLPAHQCTERRSRRSPSPRSGSPGRLQSLSHRPPPGFPSFRLARIRNC